MGLLDNLLNWSLERLNSFCQLRNLKRKNRLKRQLLGSKDRSTSLKKRKVCCSSRHCFQGRIPIPTSKAALPLPSCTVWNGQAQAKKNKTRDEVAVSTEVEMRLTREQLKVSIFDISF